jgi:hypothetical protein
LAHEAAVAFDIGTKDGCEPTFKALRGYGITSPNTKAPEEVKKSLGGFIFSTFWKPFLITSSRRFGARIPLNRNNEHDRDSFLLIPQYESKSNHFSIIFQV